MWKYWVVVGFLVCVSSGRLVVVLEFVDLKLCIDLVMLFGFDVYFLLVMIFEEVGMVVVVLVID